MVTFRTVITGISVLLLMIIGMQGYTYFFDSTVPVMNVRGIVDGSSYAGSIACSVSANKPGRLTVLVDDCELFGNQRLSSSQPYSFEIPSNVTDGKHHLKLLLTDNRYCANSTEHEYTFFVDNRPLEITTLKKNDFKVFQGRTLHVQFKANKALRDAKVEVLSCEYPCFPEEKKVGVYECFVPMQCEESPAEYPLIISASDTVGNVVSLEEHFKIVSYPFEKGTVTIAPEKLQEEEKIGLDTKRFNEEVEKITQSSPRKKLWNGVFCTPIDIQRVTTAFGTVRTTQHKGRYAHKALDVVNQPKSVVWASQDGIVVMKERFVESGNTVVVDHGFGIITMFFHLDSFSSINVGDKIAKGNPVGTIGKTGYAAGYHLHWEMRVNNIAVDPMQWVNPAFY